MLINLINKMEVKMSKNFDHKKAKEVSITVDPKGDFLDMIIDKIHDAPGRYTLEGLMESLGAKFVHYTPKESIAALEAIYEALCTEQQFITENKLDFDNADILFNNAFNSLYSTAENSHKLELIAALNDCCTDGE
jgi:hypothetical protein